MPLVINFPTDQDTEVVDAIRNAIGRNTIWNIVASSTVCNICSLNQVTGESTDPFCPVCSGLYNIYIFSGVVIPAHVTWGFSEQMGWVTGGQFDEGDCRVQIKFSDDNESVVDNAKCVEVDGRRMNIVKKLLRGVKNVNRILVDLQEEDDNG